MADPTPHHTTPADPSSSDPTPGPNAIAATTLDTLDRRVRRLQETVNYLATAVNQISIHAVVLRASNETLISQVYDVRVDVEKYCGGGSGEDILEDAKETKRSRSRGLIDLPPYDTSSGEFRLLPGPTPASVPPFLPNSPIFYIIVKGRVPGIYSDRAWVDHLMKGLHNDYRRSVLEQDNVFTAFLTWQESLSVLQIIGRIPGDETIYGPIGFHVPTYVPN
ncbi:hypothetical protein DFP72DRAFT_850972 [Ephemerocybe angulata]|uniref:Uncharacterized protein n=1 Tax=Ephemerocybe angulata TaxID=980116 RepID=A0A8H6LT85_9AGAR|nr:hypothetical protein DFP72DRAFT_1084015 [Tulosesus angulatus]KAF6751350.1 hypothetical protein DFP72DRAFT_850972 [Tulosesus angulatus]